ncbi:hypothetical protein ANN_25261 [Periplaneta americana]|uniref:Uncharacterized protein n=1 Tax=Periplaneta americana TaxID=6978 RepID=A0ABQ8S0V3_PERAM|nr:hypothetical protein ANN_25261 [Periplaneta americana]
MRQMRLWLKLWFGHRRPGCERRTQKSASANRTNSSFPGPSRTALWRLKDAGFFALIAAKKEHLKDDHKLFRVCKENANHNWNIILFSDEMTVSCTRGAKVIVYRPRGALYDGRRYVVKQ